MFRKNLSVLLSFSITILFGAPQLAHAVSVNYGGYPQCRNLNYVVNVSDANINSTTFNDSYCEDSGASQPCSLAMALASAQSCEFIGEPMSVYIPAGHYTLRTPNSKDTIHRYIQGSYNVGMDTAVLPNKAKPIITIYGDGNSTILDGNHISRVLSVYANHYVMLQNLQIINGAWQQGLITTPDGGGGAGMMIWPDSVVVMSNVNFSSNDTYGTAGSGDLACGGAIDNQGTLYLNNVTFNGNSADWAGGAICNDGALDYASSTASYNVAGLYNQGNGGAIYNAPGASLSVQMSSFLYNSAFSGGGVYIDGNSQVAPLYNAVSDTLFRGNKAAEWGGGLAAQDNQVTLQRCDFSSNTAVYAGGAAYFGALNSGSMQQIVESSFFQSNQAAGGGALDNESNSLLVQGSIFENNQAVYKDAFHTGNGGAIVSSYAATIKGTSIISNSAAGAAGAIWVGGAFILQNSVIATNSALNNASAIVGTAEMELKNNTVYDNYELLASPSAAFNKLLPQIYGSTNSKVIMAYNAIHNNIPIYGSQNVSFNGTFMSVGYNRYNGNGFRSMLNTDIQEDPQMNGPLTMGSNSPTAGPSWDTHPFVVYNPVAGGASNNTGANFANSTDDVMLLGCTAEDIMNNTRPIGGACDIGAFELPPPLVIVIFNPFGGGSGIGIQQQLPNPTPAPTATPLPIITGIHSIGVKSLGSVGSLSLVK